MIRFLMVSQITIWIQECFKGFFITALISNIERSWAQVEVYVFQMLVVFTNFACSQTNQKLSKVYNEYKFLSMNKYLKLKFQTHIYTYQTN